MVAEQITCTVAHRASNRMWHMLTCVADGGVRYQLPCMQVRTACTGCVSEAVCCAVAVRCANTMSFSKKTGNSPATAVSVKGVAPPSGTWDVNVVSAKGGCEAFMISTASVPIGKC